MACPKVYNVAFSLASSEDAPYDEIPPHPPEEKRPTIPFTPFTAHPREPELPIVSKRNKYQKGQPLDKSCIDVAEHKN